MITFRITADVSDDRQVIVTLPPEVPTGKAELVVTVSQPSNHGQLSDAENGFRQICNEKLADLQNLQANWDHEGAPPIDHKIIEAAQDFVNAIPPNIITKPPMVVPLSTGNVQLEWHHANVVLELEFESPNSVHYLKWDPDNQIEEEEVIPIANREELIGMIRWFMRRMQSGN